MKWPFVRRSFHDNIVSQLIDREFRLGEENNRLNDVISNQMGSIKSQFNEINRLNQELASELNSHRETKEKYKKAEALFDYWQKRCLSSESSLDEANNSHRETKAHEQVLFEANDKLNQQNMSLLFEIQEIKDKNNQLIIDKKHLKTKIKETESELSKLKITHVRLKMQNDLFYGNYCRFKDMIEKSGYFPGK